ncbi:GntR family transcriptional regulator [Phenylobacterium sp.]|uniref:GntR family transcriptional regulator n=1 Tax=Phenylobacterium sp. TaxID=1871053 RepID=UPI003BACD9CB
MPQRRDPFGSALAAIRRQLITGQHGPGASLSITELARELKLSQTPVREALAHLAGEGLAEERRGQGFFSPHLDSERLVEMFDLHRLYVSAALAAPWRPVESSEDLGAGEDGLELQVGDAALRLFACLVGRARNDTLSIAYQRIAERLAPIGRVEVRVGLQDLALVAKMTDRLRVGDQAGLAELLGAYYEPRRQAASELVKALRSPRPRGYIPDIV